MWLLLAPSTDLAALWAAPRLRARGIDPLLVLTPELLQHSFNWEHRLDNHGSTSVRFTLADGRPIEGSRIAGVLNRIPILPSALVGRFTPADRAYVLQEWTALHISWLSSLRTPVLNAPVMQGFCGAWRHPSEWTWLAARAGLETAPHVECVPGNALEASRQLVPAAIAFTRTVFVIDGSAIGRELPARTADACGRLGSLARTRFIGVDLDARTLRFAGASPLPDLRLGGGELLDALASTLGGF